MERYFLTGLSPQRAVAPTKEVTCGRETCLSQWEKNTD